MHSQSFSTPALILKRSDTGEADRVVTMYTQDAGKIVCIAKGVRKLTSSKSSMMEPGNIIQAFLIKTKSLPLLTQARLIQDHSSLRQDLVKIRQLTQILELIDVLFVEEADSELFEMVKQILECLSSPDSNGKVRKKLEQLLIYLGYQPLKETSHSSVMEYVEEIIERPLKSFEYLKVK
jgi:DNA repair protein RecO (recombination protein O)